jgi:hypothetical protein
MKTTTTLIFSLSAFLVGCTTTRLASTSGIGKLTVHLMLSDASEGHHGIRAEGPARIYVDGSYVGDCLPESQTVLQLATGRHRVAIEIGRAWDGSGNAEWLVSMSGRETVVVLGGESTQQLVFAKHNLKKKRVEDL